MTITLTPELEKAVSQVAQERGTTPEQVALETLSTNFLLGKGLNDINEQRRQEAIARIQSGYYALPPGTPLASEEFAANKDYEKELEERHWK